MIFGRPALGLVALVASTGCVKQMMVDGQIEATREASAAFDTLTDFEVAYAGAASALAQFEGMRSLSPDNEDALFLLAKGWTGFAYGFIEDELERAEDAAERDLAEHHKRRAVAAYDRAITYGTMLLDLRAEGFVAARTNEPELRSWLNESFTDPEDAQNLFWLGYAWVSRTNLLKDDAEAVASVWVGVQLLERSMAIDPSYNHSSAKVVLAAFHARSAVAELDEAKRMFDELVKERAGQFLLSKFQYAAKYACAKADGALYKRLLEEIVAAEDFPPELRLMNTLAQRRARRWLGEQRMFDACGIEAPGGSENAT
ncbi:MAG: hypothetical protein HYV07_23790 [Deltaproteobacteria bacterium]|nr:hypothetical protein [Deltaproteobacteria bacterium]